MYSKERKRIIWPSSTNCIKSVFFDFGRKYKLNFEIFIYDKIPIFIFIIYIKIFWILLLWLFLKKPILNCSLVSRILFIFFQKIDQSIYSNCKSPLNYPEKLTEFRGQYSPYFFSLGIYKMKSVLIKFNNFEFLNFRNWF